MNSSLKSALGIAAFMALPVAAFAHAYSAHEVPPSGSVLKQLPAALSINFTQTINRHFSGIVVKGRMANASAMARRLWHRATPRL
ncbi:hypothetical protein [Acidiphilium acidophilum]|uniref:hypothetical protein n=1 Tax=Acidiphilium acidophilum TaxID=76588 RepID=UPI002E8E7054|nr:hypothetical protein [Acidiphilium acidophilum]